jgi:SAM-dependent methyltransferase
MMAGNTDQSSLPYLQRQQQMWDQLAVSDPLWTILPERKGGWDAQEFMATGEREIEGVLDHIASLGIQLNRHRALDFGCGVGRLTQALAKRFDEACGVDISPVMVEQAVRRNQHGNRCRYMVNVSEVLVGLEDARFDLVYSSLTLMHIEPALIRGYLAELLRVLAPDGLLVFQLPTHPPRMRAIVKRLLPGPLLSAYRQVRYGKLPLPAMNVMSSEEAAGILAASGGRIVDIKPNRFYLLRPWGSVRYYVKRAETTAG